VFGFLARRNIILMLISIEVMLNAVNLSLAVQPALRRPARPDPGPFRDRRGSR
jgi:NADH:ubiquinone oxidoreductase subunit K